MAKVVCRLRLRRTPEHLYQLLAGFTMLERQGLIDLEMEVPRPGPGPSVPPYMLEVVVNGRIRVLYDMNDGYDNLLGEQHGYERFYDALLDEYDVMFKRSYSRLRNRRLARASRMHPLGLNYMVTVPGSVAHQPLRWESGQEKLAKLARMLPFYKRYNGLYSVGSFEDVPRRDAEPRILFMARLWDGDGPGLPAAKAEERRQINETRAACIRLCRKEFGSRFFGGLVETPLARSRFPDLVIADPRVTGRAPFLRRVKASAICIATTGLHQSIGWKMAEYVAASKAIVSERLLYELPGDFREGQNYLAFQDPEQCVERLFRLLEDGDGRYRMMVENYRYYQQYVRPDRLVFNSLLTALQL